MSTGNNKVTSLQRFLGNLMMSYKGLFSLMGLIGLIWAFTNTFMPYVLKLIIDHVVEFEGNKSDLLKTTYPYLFAYIGLWVILCIAMRSIDWVRLQLFPNLRKDTMSNMFRHLNQHSYRYFQNNFAGGLINKITDMQAGVVNIFSTLDDLYSQVLSITIATITLLFVNPIFSIILTGWAFTFILVTFFFLKPIQSLSHDFSECRTTIVGRMVDSVSNIINVRLFSRHENENNYIDQSINQAVKKDREMQAKIINMRIFWDISIIALISLNLIILLKLYSSNKVTIGDFTFVISLSISILWNLWFLASQFVTFSEQIGLCRQALTIISQPHEITNHPDAKPLIVSKGEIQFHDVTFHYDQGNHLFYNKNVIIRGGQKVGLVGFTGSGKSTFVNLILRLFEVESGEITIDNQNINEVTQESLRSQIALIPQDITLFHRTLLENIRFGEIDASDDDIFAAARSAHCDEFIKKLPQGYQSLVGERGIKLSGGQRQRIAIARAMLKRAPILILDEATSSLDSITEGYIQDALNKIMENKTTIVIAHRLSTLSLMDRILVFDNGTIIEDGTHESLLMKAGHYAKMWKMQASGFLPDRDLKTDML